MLNNWAEWDKEHGRSGGGARSADKLAEQIKGVLGHSGTAPAPAHGSRGSVVHHTTKADLKRAAPVKGEKDTGDSYRTKIRMAHHYANKRGDTMEQRINGRTPKTEQAVNPHEGAAAAKKAAAPKPRSAERLVQARDLRGEQDARVKAATGPRMQAERQVTEQQRANHYAMVADRAQRASKSAQSAKTASSHESAAQLHDRAAELAVTPGLRSAHEDLARNHRESAQVEKRAEQTRQKAAADRQAQAEQASRRTQEAQRRIAARQDAYRQAADRAEKAGADAKTGTDHRAAASAHAAAAEVAPNDRLRQSHEKLVDIHTRSADLQDRKAVSAMRADDARRAAEHDTAQRESRTPSGKEKAAKYDTLRKAAVGASARADSPSGHAEAEQAHRAAAAAAPFPYQREAHAVSASQHSAQAKTPVRSADKIASQARGNRTVEQEVEALKQENPSVRLHVTRGSSGHVVVHQIVVPQEKRSQGIGGRIMKRLTAAADRNGDSMALTPSKDYGGTVSRLQKFYKGHGFVPNSGRNKDFTTSESMIREPKKK